MNENPLTVLRIKGVNSKSVAATQIATTENGTQRFYPLFVVFHQATASALTVPMTASVGTNASTYTNILAATAQTGLTSALQMNVNTMVLGNPSSVAANTAVFVNVSVAAVGTSGTFDVDLFGYYS